MSGILSKEITGILTNVQLMLAPRSVVAVGYMVSDIKDRFEDGTLVRTSSIVDIKYVDHTDAVYLEGWYIQTRNSLYYTKEMNQDNLEAWKEMMDKGDFDYDDAIKKIINKLVDIFPQSVSQPTNFVLA